MNNSNELFRTFILSILASTNNGRFKRPTGTLQVIGYYQALEDLNGVDELTRLYKQLATIALSDDLRSREEAQRILANPMDALETILP